MCIQLPNCVLYPLSYLLMFSVVSITTGYGLDSPGLESSKTASVV